MSDGTFANVGTLMEHYKQLSVCFVLFAVVFYIFFFFILFFLFLFYFIFFLLLFFFFFFCISDII